MTEASSPGTDFLAKTCIAWENASAALVERGCRVVRLRLGVVLGMGGGALPRMLPAFQLGIAGRLGSGKQFMSWIALDDVVAIVQHVLRDDDLAGAYNATAPEPVRNVVFTKTLGRVLRRPTVLPAPAPVLRLLLGEMAGALLLSSTRVVPEKMLQAGYAFRHPELESALRHLLR